MKTKLDILNEIIETRQFQKISYQDGKKSRKIILDVNTASMMLKIINSLSEDKREKFLKLNWNSIINVTFKCFAT